MSSKVELLIIDGGTDTDVQALLHPASSDRRADLIQRLKKYFTGVGIGVRPATITLKTSEVRASGTFVFSSIANNDTITINGVAFTAKTSGATGNQFNLGASDTTAAAAAAVAINASVTAGITGVVTATSSSATLTITAIDPGLVGNAITTTSTGGGGAAAARLSGGTEGTQDVYSYGGGAS